MSRHRISREQLEEIALDLGVTISEGNIYVICPFGDHTTSDATISFIGEYQNFRCFSGVCDPLIERFDRQVISLAEYYELRFDKEPNIISGDYESPSHQGLSIQVKEGNNLQVSESYFNTCLEKYLDSRKINLDVYQQFGAQIEDDINSEYYGYITFQHDTKPEFIYGRLIIDEFKKQGKPKHKNSKGMEKTIYGLSNCKSDKDTILVESISNLLSLVQMGFQENYNICCSFGSSVSANVIYELQGLCQTIFILFDNDYAGLDGSQKLVKTAQKAEIPCISLRMPKKFRNSLGNDVMFNDINEVLQKDLQGEFVSWLKDKLDEFASNDIPYVSKAFYEDGVKLKKYGTGLKGFDNLLGGGFKDGFHVITAMPGVGKSAFCLAMVNNIIMKQQAKVLYCSYEISKLQVWSRLASIYSKMNFAQIEENPNDVESHVKEQMKIIGQYLRVNTTFNIHQVEKAIQNYDVCVLDYVQLAPAILLDEKTSQKENISYVGRKCCEIGLHQGKIIIGISSIDKGHYTKDQMSSKESGDVDYSAQSYTKLSRSAEGVILAKVFKNTRGTIGEFRLNADLGHTRFIDSLDKNIME